MSWMASSGSGWRRLRVWMRNVDRKEAKSAAWITKGVSYARHCSDCLANEDEDDIEKILPLAFALVVFDASNFEVVFPGRFWLVSWICKRSDWFTAGWADLLSGCSAFEKGELASKGCLILYSPVMFFCVLARGVGRSGIGTARTVPS